jgi:hypothetical protein
MWRLACLAAGIALTAAGGATAAKTSGLRGIVMRGPVMPVCVVGKPCDEPAANVRLVFLRNGKAVARIRTRGDGRYRVTLAPGVYRVSAPGRLAIGSGIEPRSARVPLGRFARVDFSIDTGVR